ncbi:hypothetical protein HYX16_01560 [Candidatus Woesearchaeota archaeon]|nr:hypothetical protein [Candidatus Woesearchaeota archaeon]
MEKNGQIWISAVLYIALGIVAITIILSAGVPLIEKIKDKNTIIQTKEILFAVDNLIREVRDEGPGSRRVVQPLIIKDGNLFIKPNQNIIIWELKTSAVFTEPCGKDKDECLSKELVIHEGPMEIYQLTTIVEDEYTVKMELNYDSIGNLILESETGKGSALTGKYTMTIENKGIPEGKSLPDIGIKAI